MLMTEARRPSRISADGELVPLAEQDRGAWDRRADRRGPHDCAGADRRWRAARPLSASGGDQRGTHVRRDIRDTDWEQLSTLYDQLYTFNPSPVVALNRAIVTAELDGPAVALAEVDRLELARLPRLARDESRPVAPSGPLGRRARGLRRRDRLAVNPAEIRYLTRRRATHWLAREASTIRQQLGCRDSGPTMISLVAGDPRRRAARRAVPDRHCPDRGERRAVRVRSSRSPAWVDPVDLNDARCLGGALRT